MRNVLTSTDGVAQAAGSAILALGGNAADAVVAGMLAGAAVASPASLLGSGVVMIAGAGVGAYLVDGRARAPGLGARRPSAPEAPPLAWTAAAPGLLEGALTAHNRFGTLPLAAIVRAATSAVKDADASASTARRLALLEALPRGGLTALQRMGVHQAILECAGPTVGGVFTRDDLGVYLPPVYALIEMDVDGTEVLLPPDDPLPHPMPAAVPTTAVAGAVCADMHGVVACALWAVAPEAMALAGETGLSLASLCAAPARNVPRWRPGTPVGELRSAAILRTEGRAWAGVAVSGTGDRVKVRDRAVAARLAAAGIAYPPPEGAAPTARGAVSWVVRDAGGDVRAVVETYDR